jgi:16S rRNA (cytosine967-C5)-methyltransferase
MSVQNLIKHAENILRAFEIEPKPIDRIVDAYYRQHRNLGSKERQLISEAVFGVMRWKRRLDGTFILGGIPRPTLAQRIAAYLLPNIQGIDRESLLTIIGQSLDFDPPLKSFPGGASAFWSYPDFIYERLVKWKGEDWAAKTAQSLNEKAQVVIRVNALKIDRDELQKQLEKDGVESIPTKYSPYGLVLKERVNLNSLSSFKQGLFEVQDEASQLIGLLVTPKEGEIIIDMCAGAGGKSLLMAMLMGNRGKIIASDIDNRKLSILRKRAKQAGVENIEILSPGKVKERYDQRADALLIDAPCSGTGTLRRSPDLKWRLTESDLRDRIEMQKQLLEESTKLLRSSGRLIYATCSILPDENEDIAYWFQKKFSWKIIQVSELLNITDKDQLVTPEGYFRTDPSIMSMDGFFGCVFRRGFG